MKKNMALFITWIGLTAAVSLVWYLRSEDLIGVLFSIGGSLIGFLLPIFLDVLLPKLMSSDMRVSRTMAKDVLTQGLAEVKQGNLAGADAPRTPLRSYPLLFSYGLVALLVISSSHGLFARGFILGLGLSLVADLFFSRRPIEYLKNRWFSVFRANLSDHEFDYFIAAVIGVYAVLTILALFV